MTDNYNFLSQLGFKLVIHRLKDIEYLVQRVNLPGLNLGYATRFTPFAQDPRSGDLTYNDFMISFKVDKQMKSYLSIHRWLLGLGFPESFQQYKDLATDQRYLPNFEEGLVTSDITLLILDNKQNPIFEVDFVSCFPISISDLQFDATATDVEYLTTEVSFKYTYFQIKSLGDMTCPLPPAP